jgi:tetratricopeptide (TPR) repeat protein
MAKKKPAGGNQGPKKGKGSRRPPKASPPHPRDRRAVEGVMWQGVGGLAEGDTPETRAQDLVYRAFDTENPAERAGLARQALDLWPDSADAYVILAEQAPSRKAALQLYEQGVAAGERAVGEKTFREYAGQFWGVLSTRPYMRARYGLAEALWTAGRRDEAIAHLQDMLRLNPGDNQGLRYTLAAWLLIMDRDEDLRRLLDQYPEEGSAFFAYTRALLAFREGGDSPEARALLKAAKTRNKHVPVYLLGRKSVPFESPPYYGFGDDNEAVVHAEMFLGSWRATPGAIDWLQANETARGRKKAKRPAAAGPSPAAKDELRELPQAFDVWEADARQMPIWIGREGDLVRPWMVLVVSQSDDLVLGQDLREERPTADHLWDVLTGAMQAPMAGEPHRPTQIELRPGPLTDALRPHLEEIGVALVPAEELDQLDGAFESLGEHLAGEAPPGLLETEGVTPEQAAAVFDAAAEFYQQAPWRDLGYEATIQVTSEQVPGGPWYAVVFGQSGMAFGIALYDDLASLQQLQRGTASDEENARASRALSLTYGEPWDIPVADLEASERHGWKVAGPNAYPSIFRKEVGMVMRPPLPDELRLMEACLRAIPGFVHEHAGDPSATEDRAVSTAAGEVTVHLAWVDDEA